MRAEFRCRKYSTAREGFDMIGLYEGSSPWGGCEDRRGSLVVVLGFVLVTWA
jgi:hypothetical protein